MADAAIKYGGGVDFQDANTSHSRMLRLVGRNKRVLEFGCSTGYMSQALQHQGCTVTGVEIDPAAAESARSFCERVIVGDLDGDTWATELGDEQFDVAVFGDVLEHLKYPATPLVRLKNRLRPKGYVVASIPNIAHGSVRLALLEGEFQYRPLGLLDDTHLRFFTRQTIEELFEQTGYRLDVMERAKLDVLGTEIHVNRYDYPPSLIDKLRQDEEAMTYQFICAASPIETEKTDKSARVVSITSGTVTSVPPVIAAKQEVENLSLHLKDAEAKVAHLEAQLTARDATLNAVLESKGWRALNVYRSAKLRLRAMLRPIATSAPIRKTNLLKRQLIDDASYRQWIEKIEKPSLDYKRMTQEAKSFAYQPLVSIIMPVFNPKQEHLERAIESVQAQIYENWQLCLCDDASTAPYVGELLARVANADQRIRLVTHEANKGISVSSNSALELAQGEFVGFLDHDDELTPHALFEVISLLQTKPDLDMVYSDEDKLSFQGERVDPFFKPDWSPEYMLSCMYTCHFGVYRRAAVRQIGGLRTGFEGSQDYDMVLRLSEISDKIAHIPKILYHWRQTPSSTAASARAKNYSTDRGQRALEEHLWRTGMTGAVMPGEGPNRYRVRPKIKGQPTVSIIIPTKDNVAVLKRCIDSIDTKTAYKNRQIIVVDNNSSEPATEQYFRGLQHDVLKFPEPFNFSRINNFAAAQAKGEYLLFLNNDTEVMSEEWLTAMLEYAQLPEVGAVGAKLFYPNGTIQHGGVVLGIGGVAGHSHKYFRRSSHGYFDSLVCIRNYSAVTAACVMIRRNVFEEVGRFDEQLAVAFNDVDLCIRIRERGYRIVWTPYAKLYHHESLSRGFAMNPNEIGLMQQRWGKLLKHDPYYNPNLTLVHENYTLAM